MEENSMEMFAFQLIANAGDARSSAFQALNAAKEADFDKATECLASARESAKKAHQIQTDLMVKEASGNKLEIGVLFVHAQDHLMTALLAEELIKEMIETKKEIYALKNQIEEIKK